MHHKEQCLLFFCLFVCFFLFGMPVHSEIIFHAVGFLQQFSAAAS